MPNLGMPETVTCPVCGATAEGGHHIGDDTAFDCPTCGGYRLSGTVIAELENGSRQLPDPQAFAELVRRKRGDSTEWPVITTYDLDGSGEVLDLRSIIKRELPIDGLPWTVDVVERPVIAMGVSHDYNPPTTVRFTASIERDLPPGKQIWDMADADLERLFRDKALEVET